MLEKPIMRAIAEHENPVWYSNFISTQSAPPLRDNRSLARLPHSFEYHLRHRIRIVNDNRAEPDIDRGRSGRKELGQIRWRGVVCGQIEEEKARDVDIVTPVRWLRDQCR